MNIKRKKVSIIAMIGGILLCDIVMTVVSALLFYVFSYSLPEYPEDFASAVARIIAFAGIVGTIAVGYIAIDNLLSKSEVVGYTATKDLAYAVIIILMILKGIVYFGIEKSVAYQEVCPIHQKTPCKITPEDKK